MFADISCAVLMLEIPQIIKQELRFDCLAEATIES